MCLCKLFIGHELKNQAQVLYMGIAQDPQEVIHLVVVLGIWVAVLHLL